MHTDVSNFISQNETILIIIAFSCSIVVLSFAIFGSIYKIKEKGKKLNERTELSPSQKKIEKFPEKNRIMLLLGLLGLGQKNLTNHSTFFDIIFNRKTVFGKSVKIYPKPSYWFIVSQD